MWAFDLIELDGADMRREPLIQRKALLERALARAEPRACSESATAFSFTCATEPGSRRGD